MKYDDEYIKMRKATEGADLIYKLGVGAGVFLLGTSSFIIMLVLSWKYML